jgi:hypothetical protein
MLQDAGTGQVYAPDHVAERSLAQILGLTASLAKTEQENELGRSASHILQLLLDTKHSQSATKHTKEVRRVSLQHFLNEIAGYKSERAIRAFFEVESIGQWIQK